MHLILWIYPKRQVHLHYNPFQIEAIRAASRAALLGISERTTDSWAACAPSPTAPRPSSVGTPRAAVKLPSEAPPVLLSSSTQGRPPAPFMPAARVRA